MERSWISALLEFRLSGFISAGASRLMSAMSHVNMEDSSLLQHWWRWPETAVFFFSVIDTVIWWFVTGIESVVLIGPRITIPRSLRWAGCGAVSTSSTTALLVRLFSTECEPQNIAAYDKPK